MGAGRGPLVRCALRAADACGATVRVYAVEKNENALVTLRAAARSDPMWHGRVTVVGCDMRAWQSPELADVMVSELLGSFGDNELSPECLDGAQRFLKPGTGTSIPSRYESFAAPVSCARLWHDARRAATGHIPGPPPCAAHPGAPPPARGLETPFVVKLHQHAPLAAPQLVFAYDHPNLELAAHPTRAVDNDRHIALKFELKVDATVHGLAGYFDAELFEDVHISILPSTFSEGMFSWFPLFIPFYEPLKVLANETLEVHLWRRHDDRKVWYEWAVVAPAVFPIQNPDGRSSAMVL